MLMMNRLPLKARRAANRFYAEWLESRRMLSSTIFSGQTAFGNIAPGGTEIYTYTAAPGQIFEVSLGASDPTSTYLPLLIISNPNGSSLGDYYTSSSHSSVQQYVGSSTPGLYTIIVQAESPSNTGNYALELDAAPATQAADADGDGGVITSGQTKSGTINRPGDLDVFTYNEAAGQSFEASLGVPDQTSAFLPMLTVYNSNGVSLGGDYTSSSHSSVQQYVGSSTPGIYTIIVQSESPTNTGTYTLELDAAPATQAADANGDGSVISSGQTKSGTINRPGDLDVFTYTEATGQSFEASLGVPDQTSAFLPLLTVYNPNGMSLGGDYTSSSHSSVQQYVGSSTPGTYTIIVQSESPTNTGTYTLELDAAPATQSADVNGDGGAITSGQTKSGTINRPGDLDVFTYTEMPGQSFEASLGVPDQSSTFLPLLTVYNPNGVSLGGDYTSSSHSSVQQYIGSSTPGTYTIIVQSESVTNTGTYMLELDAAPAAQATDIEGDGGAITSGQTKSGTINRPGDLDVFTYTEVPGQSFEASLGVPDQSSTFLPLLTVYNPNGVSLGGDYTSSSHSSVQQYVGSSTPGIYTIIVQSESPSNTGAYVLELDAVPATQAADADGDGGAISSGQNKSGTINRPGDLDIYTFVAAAGDTVSVSDTVGTPAVNLSVTIYSPTGAYLQSGNSTAPMTLVLSSIHMTGTYSVVVEDAVATGTGTYVLSLADSAPVRSPSWLAPDSGAVYTFSSNTLSVSSGIVSIISDPVTENPGVAVSVSGTAGINFTSTAHIGALSLADSATGTILTTNAVIDLTSISLSSSASLDLRMGELIVDYSSASPLSTVTSYLRTGLEGGTPKGILTTSNLAGNSSLGIADNAQLTLAGMGVSTFEGVNVDSTSLLIKYTYTGDSNLDGKVDGSDYSRIDYAYITGATGWFNGDYNYDGVVNGSDYTLIDNAFNMQGAPFATEIAMKSPTRASSVPVAVPQTQIGDESSEWFSFDPRRARHFFADRADLIFNNNRPNGV